MRIGSKGLLLALALLAAAGCDGGQPTGNSAAAALPVVPLEIRSGPNSHRFAVEVAVSQAQQEKGLSGRRSVAVDRGMVFPMMPPRTATFWMKDTHVPLDLLFVHTDGSIAQISTGQPEELTPISAGVPVVAVVELRGGRAAELGIAVGDRVRWGECGTGYPKPLNAMNFCPF
jgi:uncharacterized membrane protein (UPF0127 family)